MKKTIKKNLYKLLYLKKDIEAARRTNNPRRVAQTMNKELQAVFWKKYNKENKEKKQ